ncbi:MAG: hypothetical protein H8E66_16985 [Planctomycetes bacterium]|nr:hypothetical protein [Planctomycetota bacterium]
MPVIVALLLASLDGCPLRFLSVLVIVALHLVAASLTAAEPDLKGVFPCGCQVGTSCEIALVGKGVDQGGSLYFTQEGLSAEHIEKDRFRINVSTDSSLGDCELWLATPEGLAGPRRFSVTSNPVIVEQDSNDTRDQAQQISIPSMIEARLDKAADLDWFAFEGQQEQLITITCRSASLDGSVQAAFTLFSPNGRELVHSSSREQEPRVTHKLPTTGTYRVLVHDRAYRKDDYSIYRLEVTTGSQDVASIERTTGLLYPDDLFPAVAVQDEYEQSRQKPQSIELPSRIAGRLVERNEVDWFRFQAKKDETVHLEAFGERLGQLMDLEVAIYNTDNKLVTTITDLASPKGVPATLPLATLDPASDWKAPADGEYSLAVRDLYGGSVFGADRVYELIVEAQRPHVIAVAMPAGTKPSRGVFVKRGGDAELALTVVRTGGFAVPVTVRAMETPNGLTVEPYVLDAKEITKAVKVSAAMDAQTGFHSLRLVVEAEIDSDTHTIPLLNAVLIRSGTTRRVDEMIIYVSE